MSDLRIPFLQVAKIELPDELEDLHDLAYNLRWSWSPETRQLFSSIDPGSWARYRNPVQLLLNVERSHWETLVASDTFMESYGARARSLRAYLEETDGTWFRRRFPGFEGGPFAYFSMEYGVHQSLGIYSGGLGVLSGDHCKSASDLGLPLVAVGLLYRFGYFQQTVDSDGIQQHSYPELDFHRLPVRPVLSRRGSQLVVRVPLPEREVAAKVWLAQVGRVPLLLLDTDLGENEPADRAITNVLYVRGREMRLAQEMVLGVGGARALAELGIEPSVWHINEGHSVLLQLERLRGAKSDAGLGAAVERIRGRTVFTTHTPVPAGNEQFGRELAERYLAAWTQTNGLDREPLLALGEDGRVEAGRSFNLTALGIRTASWINGVSRLNAEVVERMWRQLFPEVPVEERIIEHVTNGVHVPTWQGVELRDLLVRRLGAERWAGLTAGADWDGVLEIPDEEIWAAHRAQKERLGRFTRARVLEQFARHGRPRSELRALGSLVDPEALTIGFARRFATYKRAGLLFTDIQRLRALLAQPGRPIQILLAGKAHPADRPGQELIRHIFQLSLGPDFRGRVIFLENYDMRVGRMLVQGVDLWLNTPRRPMEASGTSGQKAAINGVLNLSVADGWWPEGYDGENGWVIGAEQQAADEKLQDQSDALSLYRILESEVVPCYYERAGDGVPHAWVARMKRAMATVGPRFSSCRMVREYVERAYFPRSGSG